MGEVSIGGWIGIPGPGELAASQTGDARTLARASVQRSFLRRADRTHWCYRTLADFGQRVLQSNNARDFKAGKGRL